MRKQFVVGALAGLTANATREFQVGVNFMNTSHTISAAAAGTFTIGGDLTVNRLGYGAMRITGKGVWGAPPDKAAALATLRRAVELGVNLIDTADSYGPGTSEELIAEA